MAIALVFFVIQAYEKRDAGAVIHSHGIESCLVTMINPMSKEFRVSLYNFLFCFSAFFSPHVPFFIVASLCSLLLQSMPPHPTSSLLMLFGKVCFADELSCRGTCGILCERVRKHELCTYVRTMSRIWYFWRAYFTFSVVHWLISMISTQVYAITVFPKNQLIVLIKYLKRWWC